MPVIKVKKNGEWENIVGSSEVTTVENAMKLDGKPLSYFASANDVNTLQELVGSTSVSSQITSALNEFESGKTLAEHFAEENMVLTSLQYGDELPSAGTPGRIFFKKVSG